MKKLIRKYEHKYNTLEGMFKGQQGHLNSMEELKKVKPNLSSETTLSVNLGSKNEINGYHVIIEMYEDDKRKKK